MSSAETARWAPFLVGRRGAATARIVGLVLILGGVMTLGLHLAGAPESLYRWLYHQLPSGLEVPPDPSPGTVEAVRYTSLIGGFLELAVGAGFLLHAQWRSRSSDRRADPPRP